MRALDFTIVVFATWRVAALLVREDGPFDLLARLRLALDATVVGKSLRCLYCTSLWLSLPAALWLVGPSSQWPVVCLGLAGAVGLLERATTPPPDVARPLDLDEAAARFNQGRS